MLYRKITSYIEDYLRSDNRKQGEVDYLVDYFVMFFDERSGRAERTEADMSQTDESEYIF
jgi:hypothetical protein